MKRASLEGMDLNIKESIIAFFLAILPSSLKIGIYKFGGARIGRNVRIGFGAVVMAEDFSKIRIGDFTTIRNFTMIICREVDIGKYCQFAMFSWIWGAGKFSIGNKCYFGPKLRIDIRRNNFICGECSGITTGTIIYTHTRLGPYTEGWYHTRGDTIFGDHIAIGMSSIILPGVSIGRNSIVGAGSVVTRSIPPNSFAAGCPAKVVSENKFQEKINSKELTKRIITIAEDLIDYYDFKLLSKKKIGVLNIITFERSKFLSKKLWHLIVADASNLKPYNIPSSYNRKRIILFSTSEVCSAITNDITIWYDLKNLKCCSLPNKFSIDIWRFLYNTWNEICDVQTNSIP